MPLSDWSTLHGDAFAGTKCVVTGGAGFIGSHLCNALLTLGARVVALDDLSRGQSSNIDFLSGHPAAQNFKFAKASIVDASAVQSQLNGSRFVFHQAAWGSVPASVESPVEYHAVNTTGTLNVLEAARQAGVQRLVFAASSSAYGDTPTLPKVETMPPQPRSPYAANKVAGEAMLRAWACSYGNEAFDTVSLRYFNIFGPRQNANSAYAAVIAAFASALLKGQSPVIFGDGEQSRDFTYVDNAVHANLLAARAPGSIQGQAMNIACGQAVTVNQLAVRMADRLQRPDLKPEHREDRAGDVKHSLANLARAEQLIGYRPVVDFPTGLAATVDWYASEHAG